MSATWSIAYSQPLGEGGYWMEHCLSDPDTGECWSIVERLQPGPGVPVFQCLEPGCPPFCSHATSCSRLVTMGRAETCAARPSRDTIAASAGPDIPDATSTGVPSGPTSSPRRSAKRTAPKKTLKNVKPKCIATIPTTREKLAHQCRNQAVWGEHCRTHARQEAVTSWDEYPTALENQSDPFEW